MQKELTEDDLSQLAKEKQIKCLYTTENKGWYIAVLRGLDSAIETAINAEISFQN